MSNSERSAGGRGRIGTRKLCVCVWRRVSRLIASAASQNCTTTMGECSQIFFGCIRSFLVDRRRRRRRRGGKRKMGRCSQALADLIAYSWECIRDRRRRIWPIPRSAPTVENVATKERTRDNNNNNGGKNVSRCSVHKIDKAPNSNSSTRASHSILRRWPMAI